MSDECAVITDPEQATPEWLTQVLRQGGDLTRGEVSQVRAVVESSYTSTIARLDVSYSRDAPVSAPAHLFLKLSRLDAQQRVVGSAQRRAEVGFHNKVAARMPGAPVVRCYQAVHCAETGAAHLLFDDVSATHFGGRSSSPPDQPHCACAIEAFAGLHAFWWDSAALPSVGNLPDPASITSYIAAIRACFPRFADVAGDRLSISERAVYDRVLAALPRLLQRVTQGHAAHLTLIHGDANLSNVLLPLDAGKGRALIIDWQLWGISFAAEDLANLMALFWDRDQRGILERDLLIRYHTRLTQLGVKNYAWADCWHDYQLAVIVRILFMPMWFWDTGAPAASVWSSLVKALQAFADLECRELLES